MSNLVARDIERAAEAIRSANHATGRGVLDGLEASAAVGDLAELVRRLPQVLDFLTRSLRRADPTEHYDDRGADPAGALCRAHGHLSDARGLVDDLAHQLDHARTHLGHLGRRLSED
ncbi:hypothetical protein [Actinomycetospora cinnamomea]|uniref:Excreted virulence factor EspC (Type VII ESX diderm) n=1 Tax=Actinomycetospora cinnamomea TaxID=663609 RepID=A0A2U1FCV8_9PSEU|nr:hypothetical protein [Actinomycetospora cinnamomea]PVZ10012.1 hypothetical protein C8D89_10588 [Actinomycetospora cinnamomea]